ncbi:peptide ABC transporter substrate-binding protein [Levilactobacillus zymae]|uniref:peptide ABC transporter substrate-binding protein n=1 Tax=Levilactobacillus zymae TaxID=267363 RepID=UPI0028B54285|nr:peptide ABC transporter substrate-binding protein [Levilactobacillus zymae]MDT6980280.1 peptide ABC transporter substrate-binding protein [Levilactobacillus zymae]
MNKRVALRLMGVAVAISGLAGCGQSSSANQEQSKALNVTMASEMQTADPNKATDAYSGYMMKQTTEGLYRLNNRGQVVAGMATKVVKPTNQGKTYTLTLRHDAKWSNGDAVTAQDFVTSFRRQVDPTTKAQYANRFASFKNYAAVQNGKKQPSALGVKALGKYKLQITLSQLNPSFNYEAATEYLPVNRKLVKKYGAKYGTNSDRVAANGPYVLKKWNGTKTTWEYVKNPKYYAAKSVRLKQINVQVVKDSSTAEKLFAAGKVQETAISGSAVPGVKNNAKLAKQLRTTLTTAVSLQYFNQQNRLGANANFRKAANVALNREQLTQKVNQDGSKPLLNLVAQGVTTDPNNGNQDFAVSTGNYTKHNDAQAKRLWAKAKKELGGGNQTINLLSNDTDGSKNVAEYIQSQWEKDMPGLKVTITAVPLQQEINKMFKQNFDVAMFGWTGDEPDPTNNLNLLEKGNSINFSNYNDRQYNQLMTRATQETNTKKRMALLKQANRRGMQLGIFNPLYQQSQVNLVSDKVGGIHYSTYNLAAQYRYAYWK